MSSFYPAPTCESRRFGEGWRRDYVAPVRRPQSQRNDHDVGQWRRAGITVAQQTLAPPPTQQCKRLVGRFVFDEQYGGGIQARQSSIVQVRDVIPAAAKPRLAQYDPPGTTLGVISRKEPLGYSSPLSAPALP